MQGRIRPIGHTGWRNYETSATAEWLRRENASSAAIAGLVKRARETARRRGQQPQWFLADWLRDSVEAGAMEVSSSLHRELLRAALAHVDWDDVAEELLRKDPAPEQHSVA